jgi:uncharacterized membrane protein YdjX (TVP38/TMEM64 family)
MLSPTFFHNNGYILFSVAWKQEWFLARFSTRQPNFSGVTLSHDRNNSTKMSSKLQLSLSRNNRDFPKQSPLRETLPVNTTGDDDDLGGAIPCLMMSSPSPRNNNHPLPATSWPSDEPSEQQQHPPRKVGLCHELFSYFINRSRTKKFISALIITSLILVIIEYILYNNSHISTFISNFLDWMKSYGDLAVVAYIIMMSILTLFFVPPSLFVFASGFIFQDVYEGWGILVAWVASFLGTLIGGSLGFWRARYLSRDLVEILMRRYPILRAVDTAIVKNSLRVMMLMRLNPLIPFGVLNYVL